MTQLGTQARGLHTEEGLCDDDPEVTAELRAAGGTRGLGPERGACPPAGAEGFRQALPVTTHLPQPQRARLPLQVQVK